MTHVQLVPYRRHIPDYSTTVHQRITPTASHMRIPCHQLFAGQFHLTFRFPRVYFTVFILQFNLVHAKYACSLSCIPSLDFSFSYSFSKQFMYTFSLAFVPTYLLQLLKYAKKTYIILNTILWQGMLLRCIYVYVVQYSKKFCFVYI